jgi:hypothetical protein
MTVAQGDTGKGGPHGAQSDNGYIAHRDLLSVRGATILRYVAGAAVGGAVAGGVSEFQMSLTMAHLPSRLP